MTRESVLTRTLVTLADNLVGDFDVIDVLTVLCDRCVEVLEVEAAGVMLATPDGQLRVMASSSEAMRVLEVFEIQAEEGPCLDAHRTGEPVVNQDLDASNGRWPRFAAEAVEAGFHSAHALPMRRRDMVIGALNLFRTGTGQMGTADLEVAQALADVATITIIQHRAASEAQALAEQLTHALNSRIILEQAKGVIAERLGLDMERSFATLRNHARNHNLRLGDVAESVIDGSLAPSELEALPTPKADSGGPSQREAGDAQGARRDKDRPRHGVADADGSRLDLGGLLAAVEAAPPVEATDVMAAELARVLDATEVSLLVANLSGTAAVRMARAFADDDGLTDERDDHTESVPLDGSAHHWVLTSQKQHVERNDGGWRILVPVTERGDAIGILELSVPRQPDDEELRYLTAAAHALAYTIVASRRHTDLFEEAQRDVPFSLAAEIQRRLLPDSYTVEGGSFTLAGWLEPAANVGGDTFDYSIDREYLYASVTDAMGHSTRAAQLATLTVGSFRNTRRSAAPAEQANEANEALIAGADPDQFVTGQLLRICLADGTVDIVNAGHPLPFLLRAGAVSPVDLTPDPPLGIASDPYHTQHIELEAGDRLLIVTDGFLERNADFAIGDILTRSADQHPREVVRELSSNLLAVTGGDLSDDATVLCIDWHGHGGVRDATGGASHDRTTPKER